MYDTHTVEIMTDTTPCLHFTYAATICYFSVVYIYWICIYKALSGTNSYFPMPFSTLCNLELSILNLSLPLTCSYMYNVQYHAYLHVAVDNVHRHPTTTLACCFVPGNILYSQEKKGWQLIPIDFEYASYNYR